MLMVNWYVTIQYLTGTRPTAHQYIANTLPKLLQLIDGRSVNWYSTHSKIPLSQYIDRLSTDIATDTSTTKLHLPLPSGGCIHKDLS